jgi:hypothetical protein
MSPKHTARPGLSGVQRQNHDWILSCGCGCGVEFRTRTSNYTQRTNPDTGRTNHGFDKVTRADAYDLAKATGWALRKYRHAWQERNPAGAVVDHTATRACLVSPTC